MPSYQMVVCLYGTQPPGCARIATSGQSKEAPIAKGLFTFLDELYRGNNKSLLLHFLELLGREFRTGGR
jgi:hypothetical protein